MLLILILNHRIHYFEYLHCLILADKYFIEDHMNLEVNKAGIACSDFTALQAERGNIQDASKVMELLFPLREAVQFNDGMDRIRNCFN